MKISKKFDFFSIFIKIFPILGRIDKKIFFIVFP